MEKLSKEEEKFLNLLLEQDWEKDIHAYIKFRVKLPENLVIIYEEIIQSLKDKGYIRKKYIRQFILSEEAKNYRNKKLFNLIKNIFFVLYKYLPITNFVKKFLLFN